MAARHVDIDAAIKSIRYYAGWADKNHGKTIEVRSGVLQVNGFGSHYELRRLRKSN